MTQVISIKVFGAPTVLVDGEAVVISRARVRGLLWLLAAENRPLDRERLGYLLWPEETTKVAQRNLSTHLSYARKAVGSEVFSVTGEAIALSDAVETDLRAFNALASTGDVDSALQALSLASGYALEGVGLRDNEAYDQWLTSSRLVLNRRIIDLALRTARSLTDAARAAEAQDVLEGVLDLDPFNEEICQLSMRALCKLGRRFDAIRLYHDLVDSLNRELGIPPTDETVRCYQEIIGNNQSYPAALETTAPKSDVWEMPFVGREQSLEFLAAHGHARLLIVQGKSGYGKTRLIREYLSGVETRQLAVQAIPQETAIPFSLVRSILREALGRIGDRSSSPLSSFGERQAKILRFLLPEIKVPDTTSPGENLISPREVTAVLGSVLERFCNGEAAMLFIDDLHYADPSSLKALKHFLTESTFGPLRLMGALRPSLAGYELLSFLNDMERDDPTVILELGKLKEESMQDLLSYYFPDIDCATASRLITLADGNPYWLKCIMQGLDDGYTEFSGANSLMSLFDRSYRSLSERARGIVRLLALYGGCCDNGLFDLWCAEASPAAMFSELASARLISRNNLNQVVIAHSKILDFIMENLDPSRHSTKRLEHDLACSLAEYYDGTGAAALVIADHFMKSGHPEDALPYAFAAGNHLIHIDDIERALHYYKIAYRYASGEEKLRNGLILIDCYLETSRLYEMNLYTQNALDYAIDQGFRSYALLLRALQALAQIPEFHELRKYVYPAYRIRIDPTVAEWLAEAQSLVSCAEETLYLTSFIQSVSALCRLLTGNVEKAKEELRRSLSATIGLSEEEQRSYLPLLHLHSTILLITVLNYNDDAQIAGVIQAEYNVYDEVPLNRFTVFIMESQALSAILDGKLEEGVALMDRAIRIARDIPNGIPLIGALLVQAMLVREANPLQSYTLNHEAYCLAKKHHLGFSLVRSLVGLIKTSPDRKDALTYYRELERVCGAIGDATPLQRVADFADGAPGA